MRKTLLFLIATFFLAANVSAQWIEQVTGLSVNRAVNQIVITSQNTAWVSAFDAAAGANVRDYSRTTDGGATWTAGTVSAAPTSYNWSCLAAVDANTAWAMFFKNTATATGRIYKTTDGGTTWTQQGTGVIFNTSGVSFPDVLHFWDANIGVAVGDPVNGEFEIYTTTDGGTTWTPVPGANIPDPTAGEYGLTRSFAARGNTFWFGTNAGRVFRSTDYGATWTVYSTGTTNAVVSLDFADDMTGWIEMSDPSTFAFLSLYRTYDGGDTWTDITPSDYFYNASGPGDISFVPNTTSTIVAAGYDTNSALFGSEYSLDGGDTWVEIDNDVIHLTVEFYDNITAWSGGLSVDQSTGGISKYDGGFVATGIAPVVSDYTFKLYPNPSDGLFYISFDAENNLPINLQITDAMGKLVMQTSYKDKSQLWLKSIDMRKFQNGVYFLKIENNGVETMRKLIVQ
ncbi:MAG: T9SS type A sorting domain-containing protein [Chitinophagaceae bacterium]|nr:T9SS type A sorting domain-containing protein [Chitinophagaceae bacterium]